MRGTALAALTALVTATSLGAQEPTPEPKDPGTAQSLALIPGAGYVYAGEPATGLLAALTIALGAGMYLTDEACTPSGRCTKPTTRGQVLGLIAVVGWAYSIFDSGEAARRWNREHGIGPVAEPGPEGSLSVGVRILTR